MVVTLDQVMSAEDGAAGQLAAEVLHVGEKVPVCCGDVVESPVVTTGTPGAV